MAELFEHAMARRVQRAWRRTRLWIRARWQAYRERVLQPYWRRLEHARQTQGPDHTDVMALENMHVDTFDFFTDLRAWRRSYVGQRAVMHLPVASPSSIIAGAVRGMLQRLSALRAMVIHSARATRRIPPHIARMLSFDPAAPVPERAHVSWLYRRPALGSNWNPIDLTASEPEDPPTPPPPPSRAYAPVALQLPLPKRQRLE